LSSTKTYTGGGLAPLPGRNRRRNKKQADRVKDWFRDLRVNFEKDTNHTRRNAGNNAKQT